jgi:hypothetical protein
MEKWVCVVCGYVYDEAEGDPDSGIAPGTNSRIFLMIGFALCAVLRKTSSKNKRRPK